MSSRVAVAAVLVPPKIGIPGDDIRSRFDTEERVLLSSRGNLLSKHGPWVTLNGRRSRRRRRHNNNNSPSVTFCGERKSADEEHFLGS